MATKGQLFRNGVRTHKPVQTHQLQDGGDQVKLVGHHAAEDRGHLSFEALQDQLGQQRNRARQANHLIPTTTRLRQARRLTLSVNTVIETIFVKKNVP